MPPKATRRSTRSRASAKSEGGSELEEPIEAQSESDTESEPQEETQKGKKRKRNTKVKEDAPAEPAPPPKKPKGKGRQRVQKEQTDNPLLDLPFDIHLEICSYLGPMNLLNLARTCRGFHQLVVSDEFDLVWRNLRKSRFPDMPECPSGMTEPAFFELCFGRGCLVCGSKPTPSAPLNLLHVWEARIRICAKCIRSKWTTENPFSYFSSNKSAKALRELDSNVPYASSYLTKEDETYYSAHHIEAWIKEFESQTRSNREKWVAEKKASLEEIKLHAQRCQKWHKAALAAVHDEEDKEIFDGRMEIVLTYIRSLGWGEEMDKQTNHHPRKVEEFNKLCEKKITPKVLADNKSVFVEYMEWARKRRLETEQSNCIKRRLRWFKHIYETQVNLHIKPEDPRPRVSDVFAIPRFSGRILYTSTDVEVNGADFHELETNLEGVIEEAKDIIKRKMLALVEEGMGDEPYDPETVLDLATTVFCEETFSRYDDTYDIRTVPEAMAMHVVASNGAKSFHSLLVQEVLGGVPWNTGNSKLKFDKKSSDLLGSLLSILGLNPKTTTLREIEELDPIFECVQCNRMKEGRLIMNWGQTMKHLKEIARSYISDMRDIHQSLGASVFEIVQGEDATRGRFALKEQHLRWLYGLKVKPTALCRHCPDTYSAPLDKVLWHLNTKHVIALPREGDYKLVFQNDVQQYPKIEGRLWPPRSPTTGFKD
ncbi:hypothetical protein CVT24_007594 [Panaeolus cyanescens]|uniref:F-box domain-containing protein n=1 Tax=Panaeolus cyanescens TaxID=181874 RepID=A0A409YKQ2_9AGAR|nr:hypothetical protein CVT24_007594 [Panaeolus cyanescens]